MAKNGLENQFSGFFPFMENKCAFVFLDTYPQKEGVGWLNERPPSRKDGETSGRRGKKTSGHQDIETSRHRDIKTSRHQDIKTSSFFYNLLQSD